MRRHYKSSATVNGRSPSKHIPDDIFLRMLLISERNQLPCCRYPKIKEFDVRGAQVERLVPVRKAIGYGNFPL